MTIQYDIPLDENGQPIVLLRFKLKGTATNTPPQAAEPEEETEE